MADKPREDTNPQVRLDRIAVKHLAMRVAMIEQRFDELERLFKLVIYKLGKERMAPGDKAQGEAKQVIDNKK